MQNAQATNNVTLTGKISSDFEYGHHVFDIHFYNFTLSVPRLSGALDKIPITSPQQLISSNNLKPGDTVYITGQFRSYNNYSGMGNKLILFVFAKTIDLPEKQLADNEYLNEVLLSGYVCKTPIHRTTPFGREITDLLIAVNRAYNKSDYIPCITWGKNANLSSKLEIGNKVDITGRIQSREYQKKINENEHKTKTAFEVSISKISFIS